MRLAIVAFLGVAVVGSARAEPVDVDVELVLMVDVSRSMGPAEIRLQRRGYAEALASDEVVDAIVNGGTGAVAVTYVEWGSRLFQRVVLPWTLIDSRETARSAARRLEEDLTLSMKQLLDVPYHLRQTSISGAIEAGERELERNRYRGLRKVIDVSGDGPNNDGDPVTVARDAAIAAGVIVNGLPLVATGPDADPESADLDLYFSECVIGGPGAFVLPMRGWSDLGPAVRRKLVLEMAGRPESVLQTEGVIGRQGRDVDCMIGETMRQAREAGR
jgi:hypothetical protein